jgi:hypothetical protein
VVTKIRPLEMAIPLKCAIKHGVARRSFDALFGREKVTFAIGLKCVLTAGYQIHHSVRDDGRLRHVHVS